MFYKADPLMLFEPRSGKQAEFLRSPAKVVLALAGNQSGKTTILCVRALSAALNRDSHRQWPIPNHGFIGTSSFDLIGDQYGHGNIVPKLFELCPKDSIQEIKNGQSGAVAKIVFKNGSTIEFASYEQKREVWEAGTKHWYGLDEPPPKEKFNAVKRGAMKLKAPIWMIMTLLSEPWVLDDVWENAALTEGKDVCRLEWNTDDNPFLDKNEIEFFLTGMDDEERERRKHGRPRRLHGKVYKAYRDTYFPNGHLIKPINLRIDKFPVWEAIDPHDSKDDYILWVAVGEGNKFYVVDEARNWGDLMDLKDIVFEKRLQLFGKKDWRNRIVNTFIDYSSANVHRKHIELDWSSELKRIGLPVRNAKKHGKAATISRIKYMLKFKDSKLGPQPDLFVCDNCTTFRKQFRNLHYEKMRRRQTDYGFKEEPAKFDDDLHDCLCYIVAANLRHDTNPKNFVYTPQRNVGRTGY